MQGDYRDKSSQSTCFSGQSLPGTKERKKKLPDFQTNSQTARQTDKESEWTIGNGQGVPQKSLLFDQARCGLSLIVPHIWVLSSQTKLLLTAVYNEHFRRFQCTKEKDEAILCCFHLEFNVLSAVEQV